MKKIFAILVLVVCGLGLNVGCQSNNPDQEVKEKYVTNIFADSSVSTKIFYDKETLQSTGTVTSFYYVKTSNGCFLVKWGEEHSLMFFINVTPTDCRDFYSHNK